MRASESYDLSLPCFPNINSGRALCLCLPTPFDRSDFLPRTHTCHQHPNHVNACWGLYSFVAVAEELCGVCEGILPPEAYPESREGTAETVPHDEKRGEGRSVHANHHAPTRVPRQTFSGGEFWTHSRRFCAACRSELYAALCAYLREPCNQCKFDSTWKTEIMVSNCGVTL